MRAYACISFELIHAHAHTHVHAHAHAHAQTPERPQNAENTFYFP